MPLASTVELLTAARAAGRGLGAFNVILVEHAEGLVAGAERADAPVVLQISENCVRYHGALRPIALATLEIARSAGVLVAVHLDHATRVDLVEQACELGLSSVMFDASTLDYAANVAATADVVRRCHAAGLGVEAELGEIGGKDGVHAPGARTDPDDAAAFVAATGVDALAIAVGSSHAMVRKTAALDLDLIAANRARVPVPLVLHGSSGVPDADLTRAVEAGITKVNVATSFNQVFTAAVRNFLTRQPDVVDPRKYVAVARDAVATEAARLVGVLHGR